MNKNWYHMLEKGAQERLKLALTSKEVEIVFTRLREILDTKQKGVELQKLDLDKPNWEGRVSFSQGYKNCIKDLYEYINE